MSFNLLEALKNYATPDGKIDLNKFQQDFEEYQKQTQSNIQPVNDSRTDDLELFKRRSDVEFNNQERSGQLKNRDLQVISDVGAGRYAQDTDAYTGAQERLMAPAYDQADKTRAGQAAMFDKILADRQAQRVEDRRTSPTDIVNMIARLGATAGLLFK